MPAETGARCRPALPVPVVIINGPHDPLVPYQGGQVRMLRNRGSIWSTVRAVEFLANVNGCSGARRSMALPDRDPSDGTITIRHDYQSCRAPVTLLEVEGGGHARWEPVSRDFDASEAIVGFLKSAWQDAELKHRSVRRDRRSLRHRSDSCIMGHRMAERDVPAKGRCAPQAYAASC
jgi:poly(3-hydroxybutyrate) depolymerase